LLARPAASTLVALISRNEETVPSCGCQRIAPRQAAATAVATSAERSVN